MKLSKRTALIIAILLAGLAFLAYSYLLPVVSRARGDLQAYDTRVAYRDNYKLHTTPLTQNVVDDICSKLGIQASNPGCQSYAVAYAPEFFGEIKAYFNGLPDSDKTYAIVQDKLGRYQVQCEEPNYEGHYRCKYDFRGDQVYPIFFYFDKDGFYYRIIANTGGS